MNRIRLPLLCSATLCTAAFALASSVAAHHSTAMFDFTKKMTVTGTVKEWQWTNPHAWLQLMTDDGQGHIVEQGFEAGSPVTMVRSGFKASTFKAGDKVTIVAAPRKEGTLGGELIAFLTPEGTWLQWGPTLDTRIIPTTPAAQ